MSKVFVTQFDPRWDFAPALEWGSDVRFITDQEMVQQPCPPHANDLLMAQVKSNLKDYTSGEDFVVLTAAAPINVLVAMELAKKPGTHNFLRWHTKRQKYNLYQVEA
jgi:hypothetical protein